MAEYEECDRLAAVSEGRTAIVDFLEWMSQQGYQFMRFEDDVPDSRPCSNGYMSSVKQCQDGQMVRKRYNPERWEPTGEQCLKCAGTGIIHIKVSAYMGDRRSPDDLVYAFYDIDPTKLERERRAMLADLAASS